MSQDGAQGVAKLSQDGILGSEFEVWRDLGRSWGSLGGHFERCWLEVGVSWLMLLCCEKFEQQNGSQDRHLGDQERQDEPR